MRRGLAGIALAVALLAALPFVRESLGLTGFYIVILYNIFFWTAQSTSWNILSGYAGYFSFGQGAFVGVGAYTAAVLSGRHGVSYFYTLPLAGAFAVVLALVVGGVAFRLRSFRGEIFALLTLAVPFILSSVARLSTTIDGGQGIIVPAPTYPDVLGDFQDFLYLLNLAIAALAVGIAYGIQHSRFGWALTAIRDSEDVAEGLGVPTFRYKMLAIGASGLIGGISGAAYAQQIGFVNVQAVFGLTIPLFVIVMSVLGGRTHWLGPVIGATFIVLLQDRLVVAGFESWRLIIFGSILAFVVVAAPEGLQARLRARPLAVLGAFVVLAVGSVLIGMSDELLDAVSAGMVGAAVVALWPAARPRAGRRPAPVESGEPVELVEPIEAALDAQPAGAAAIVECSNLSRYFGGVRALDDLTLTIYQGELIGLVGPNGSGKTTLVNLLSRTFRPTQGGIRIAGEDISGLPPHRVAHAGVAPHVSDPAAVPVDDRAGQRRHGHHVRTPASSDRGGPAGRPGAPRVRPPRPPRRRLSGRDEPARTTTPRDGQGDRVEPEGAAARRGAGRAEPGRDRQRGRSRAAHPRLRYHHRDRRAPLARGQPAGDPDGGA